MSLSSILVICALAMQADPFEGLERGGRVQIRLITGYTLRGTVTQVSPSGRCLRLDVSEEYPDVKGTMRVLRKRVASVRLLGALSEQERRVVAEAKREARRELAEADARRREAEQEAARRRAEAHAAAKREAGLQEKVDLERRVRARELYESFPETAGWGEGAFRDIEDRIRTKGLPPTRPELEFYRGYDLWKVGRDLVADAIGPPPPPLICPVTATIVIIHHHNVILHDHGIVAAPLPEPAAPAPAPVPIHSARRILSQGAFSGFFGHGRAPDGGRFVQQGSAFGGFFPVDRRPR